MLAAGHTVNGAARWITFAGFQFQPSEFSKLLLIVGLAALLASRRGITSPGRLTLLALGYIGLPALLVFREPDFGTALVLAAMLMGMLFVYGVPWRHFVWMILTGAVALALIFSILPGAGIHVLQSYQVDRITAFLHPGPARPAAERLQPEGVDRGGEPRRAWAGRASRTRPRRSSATCPSTPPTSSSPSSARSAGSSAPPG